MAREYRVQPFHESAKNEGYRVRRGHGWKGHVAYEFTVAECGTVEEARKRANHACDQLNKRQGHPNDYS